MSAYATMPNTAIISTNVHTRNGSYVVDNGCRCRSAQLYRLESPYLRRTIFALRMGHHRKLLLQIFHIFASFLSPTLILVFCYSRIIQYFRASKLELKKFGNKGQNKIKTVDKRLLRSVAVILAVFSFLWTPYCIFAFTDDMFHWSRNYYMFGVTCAHLTSCINSVIYATTNVSFRKGYIKVLRRFCQRKTRIINDRQKVRRQPEIYCVCKSTPERQIQSERCANGIIISCKLPTIPE